MPEIVPQFKGADIKIRGMDCAECAQHVEQALNALKGVRTAQVYLAAERASIVYDEHQVNLDTLRAAVEKAGYDVVDQGNGIDNPARRKPK